MRFKLLQNRTRRESSSGPNAFSILDYRHENKVRGLESWYAARKRRAAARNRGGGISNHKGAARNRNGDGRNPRVAARFSGAI